MREYDDNQLLALVKSGSAKAYEILFERYYKFLCLQASLVLMDEAEAEDAVLELFVEIWDKKIYRQIDQSFKSYLYRAVRNKCLNLLKRNKLIRQKQKRYQGSVQKVWSPSWSEQKELAANINSVLQEFPEQRLKVFTLVYLEKKRYQEAADEMGLSINSVKTHLKLAIQVLRNKLARFR